MDILLLCRHIDRPQYNKINKENVFSCGTHGRKLLDSGEIKHLNRLEQTVPSAHSGLRIVTRPRSD